MAVQQETARALLWGFVGAVSTLMVGGVVKVLTGRAVIASSRVNYQNGEYLVAVRGPGEWHDVREFVQPNNVDVQAIYQQIGADVWECYRWVCEKIGYRFDADSSAFPEYWYFPSETIKQKYGDCDDTSILLASLLRNFTDAYVVAGTYRGYGHAWVSTNNQILETTLIEPIVVDDPWNYRPYVYFNEREVIEIWPGALQELMGVERNASRKLRLIAS